MDRYDILDTASQASETLIFAAKRQTSLRVHTNGLNNCLAHSCLQNTRALLESKPLHFGSKTFRSTSVRALATRSNRTCSHSKYTVMGQPVDGVALRVPPQSCPGSFYAIGQRRRLNAGWQTEAFASSSANLSVRRVIDESMTALVPKCLYTPVPLQLGSVEAQFSFLCST